jgi:hypothetical protein
MYRVLFLLVFVFACGGATSSSTVDVPEYGGMYKVFQGTLFDNGDSSVLADLDGKMVSVSQHGSVFEIIGAFGQLDGDVVRFYDCRVYDVSSIFHIYGHAEFNSYVDLDGNDQTELDFLLLIQEETITGLWYEFEYDFTAYKWYSYYEDTRDGNYTPG